MDGEPNYDEPTALEGKFVMTYASTSANDSTAVASSNVVFPMIAYFQFNHWEVKFNCELKPATRSFEGFKVLLMNESFGLSFVYVNSPSTEPDLGELDQKDENGQGFLKLEIQAILQDDFESEVELWAKERVGDDVAWLTEEEIGALGLGYHEDVDANEEKGSDEEEDDEEEEEQGDGWC